MTPTEFQQLVGKALLGPKERAEAWRRYKSISPEEGLAFLQELKTHSNQLQLREEAVPYQIFGKELIDEGALSQMANAARLPIALAGALMPDAHQGYGLPIGGVLATDNSVIPYAVGVDIACRMMMTLYSTPSNILQNPQSADYQLLQKALVTNTIFGSGEEGVHSGTIDHPILEPAHWEATPLTRSLRLTAIHQIGTSGTGNHFVEWGELQVIEENNPLNLKIGHYLALLSHSGSRGVGFKIAHFYTKMAMDQMPHLDPTVKHLAWLPLNREPGQEYWNAMELAGEFASANHQIIHSRISQAAGIERIASIENHHNFAWREKILINGIEKEAIVHRKGATPARKGVLGVIPGTMADPGYLVVGKGASSSLNSASHGSGREMSRSKAVRTISSKEQQEYLAQKGVTLIGGGVDESPQAYKPIKKVIEAQADLITIFGLFQPRIVRMALDSPNRSRKKAPIGVVDGD